MYGCVDCDWWLSTCHHPNHIHIIVYKNWVPPTFVQFHTRFGRRRIQFVSKIKCGPRLDFTSRCVAALKSRKSWQECRRLPPFHQQSLGKQRCNDDDERVNTKYWNGNEKLAETLDEDLCVGQLVSRQNYTKVFQLSCWRFVYWRCVDLRLRREKSY